MTDKYEALKAAALAATPGRWELLKASDARPHSIPKIHVEIPHYGFDDRDGSKAKQQTANATYIAAASPDVVLALIAEVENLKAYAMHERSLGAEAGMMAAQEAMQERDALAAKLAEMEAQVCVATVTDNFETDYSEIGRTFQKPIPIGTRLYLAPGANPDAKDAPKADMFWNADDTEQLYSCIEEFLNDEICNGSPLEVGHIRTIQRAVRLPNIDIRITSINDEECEAEYEVIDAAIEGAKK